MEDENFDKCLEILNGDEALKSSVLAKSVIENLSNIFQGDLTSIEATVYTASILSSFDGIPKFISLVACNKSIGVDKPPIKEAFLLLEYIVENFPRDVELIANEVVSWCVRFLNHAVPNETKCYSIKLAVSIINSCSYYQIDWDLLLSSIKHFLVNDKKTPPTLIEPIFNITGAIFKFWPDITPTDQDWFFNLIVKKMNEFRFSKNISDTLLIACFKGLCGILVNFPPNNSECSKSIYMNLKLSSNLKEKGERNTIGKSALSLFSTHASHFVEPIYNDYKEWHSILLNWIEPTTSKENNQIGYLALIKLYKIIVLHLTNNNPDNGNVVFYYFQNHFGNHGSNHFYQIKNRFAGLSEFFEMYSKYECEKKLTKTMNEVINSVQTIYDNYPSIVGMQLTAVSKISASYRNGSRLCKLALSILDVYPRVDSYSQSYLLESLQNSFISWYLHSKSDTKIWLDIICYQGLLYCCAYPIYVDVQLVNEDNKQVSYKSFVKLWSYLLTISKRGSHSVSLHLGKLFFEAFMLNYLKIVKKLDLSLNTITDESFDPSISKQAKNPNDFQIFVNLVDLFQDTIPFSDTYQVRNLMYDFILDNTKLSLNYPLISGFYKILAACFQASTKEDLLDPNDYDGLVSFVRWAVQRLDFQKDDLLIANLRMILSAPAGILENILSELDVVILTGARVGRTYPEILELCIEALEIWNYKFSNQNLKSLLCKVLPSLSFILVDPANPEFNNPLIAQNKTSLFKSRGAIRKKILGPTDKKIAVLRQKLLLFISKLDPLLCSEVFEPLPSYEHSANQMLNYKIPLLDSRLLLPLNSLLPRIMDLAVSSTERNIRITACELLHAILLIAIARTREPNNNVHLLKLMLRTSLLLSSDTDLVVRDMFNPLLIQITHYFSSKIHMNSNEAGVLIEILMEGVTHSYDYALRDFSANCLKEFVIWSARQLSPELLAVGPFNIQAVLRMICDYSLHPDRCKRIGAAIAFNKLYNEFREDKNILHLFWIRLYYCFVCSLELSFFEEDAEIITSALHHIQRPLLQQSQLFLTDSPKRRVPSGMQGGTIKDVAIFSFHHCKSNNQFLRDYSMSVIKKLLVNLPENPSLRVFVSNFNISINFDESCDGEVDKILGFLQYALWLVNENIIDLKDISANIMKLSQMLLISLLKNHVYKANSTVVLCNSLSLIASDLSKEIIVEFTRFMKDKAVSQNEKDVDESFIHFIKILKKCDHWDLFISNIPSYDEDSLLNQIASPCNINYVWILKILDKANCLNLYYSGNKIIITIFENLFKKKGSKIVSIAFNNRLVENLKDLILFSVKHGLNSQLVIELLTDSCDIIDGGNKTTKGRYFFETFKLILVPFLIGQQETTVLLRHMNNDGICWIITFLQHIRDNSKDEKNVKLFIFRIFSEWNLWIKLSSNKWQLFEVIKTISQINDYKTNSDFLYISSWYYNIPNDLNLEPEDILNYFEVLPSFITYLETENIELARALTIFDKKWLLYKKGVSIDSTMYTTAQLVIEQLLICLKNTCSLVIWKFILEALSQNLKMVNKSLLSEVIDANSKCPSTHITQIQDILFNFIFQELVEKESVKFVENVITSFLNCSAKPVTIRFCELFLPQLLNILVTPLTERKERDLVRKISATNIMHTLYSITTKEDRIKLQEYFTNIDINNKDIFQKIIKACEFGHIKSNDFNKNEKEMLRLLNCACVNFMCLFVSLSPNEKYYEMFLFRKNLWESVIDDSIQYNITMDFKNIPKIKKIATSIENSTQKNKNNAHLKYAQSHVSTLFLSSLSEDVRKFDLTNASITQHTSSVVDDSSKISFELELDMLNQHETVPMICAIIGHMINKQYNSWVPHLLNSLENGSKNTKLVILKIIHNVQDDVKPFYNEFSPVLLKNIVELFENMSVNYFFVDLINMLIDWKPPLLSESNLTGLIECFISKINSQRRDIIKFVFNIVKNIVEEWKYLLKSHQLHHFLMTHINSSPSDDIICYIYINLSSILLANNLFLINVDDCNIMVAWLQKCMHDKKNNKMAAEVCGLLLNNCSNFNFFPNIYNEICKHIQEAQKSATSSDAILLYHIHKFFPTICNNFTSLLISRGWHDRSQQKQFCLEMLLCYVKAQGCLHDTELITCFTIFATDILKCGIIPAQELILKIILEVFQTLSETTIFSLMPHLVLFSRNKFIELRRLSCDILMNFFKYYKDEQRKTSEWDDIKLLCKTALIDRINDSDCNLQNSCLNFWSEFNIPKITKDRLNFILTDLYSSDAEIELVEYASRLLLQAASLSPDYNLEIFDHPLTDCTYSELKLLVSWRARCSLAPMFVPSIATELGRLHTLLPEASTINFRLRETARSLMFTPTLANNNDLFLPTEVETEGFEFKKPKRPFRFSRNTNSSHFVKQAVATKERTKANFEEKLRERDSNVTIYRSYRVGDFPDIQIKNAHFLTLLMALIGKDSHFAKELFILLVSSIINETGSNEVYLKNLTEGLNHFLKYSDGSHSVSIGAVFEIALNNGLNFQSEDICRVTRSSKLLSSGVQLLEKIIFLDSNDGPTPLKRMKTNISDENSWLRLAEFYHKMQDFDALRGIFLDKLSVDGVAKKAIMSETLMDWSSAVKNYGYILTEDLDPDRKNFFNQSYLNCLANLSEWGKITECIVGGIQNDHNQLWNNSWCFDILLPWYLKSEMMTSLSTNSESFQDLIFRYQSEPEKEKQMSLLFTEEVTISNWLKENVGKTISSMHRCFLEFLTKWSNTSQWDKQLKMSLLSKLKIISEIHCVTHISTYFVQMQDTSEIMKYIGKEISSNQSNLLLWDVRMTLRNKLLTKLNKNMNSCDLSSLSNNIIDLNLNIVQSSIQQGNIHLARKYWRDIEKKEMSSVQNNRWRHLKNLIAALKVKKSQMTCLQKLLDYCNIINNIETFWENTMEIDGNELSVIQSKQTVLNIVSDMISECITINIDFSNVAELPIDKRNLKDFWLNCAEAIIDEPINNDNIAEISNTYVEISKFCRNYNCGTQETIVKYLLKAMQCGSNEAMELFASVTTMNELIESDEIEIESRKVPTWMFLKWRHQFVAHLANNPKAFIQNILKRIAEKYPNSLSYGLRISKENFSKSLNEEGFVQQLSSMVLNNPTEEMFVEAIGKLANPFVKIKYYVNKIMLQLEDPNFDKEEVRKVGHILKNIVTDENLLENYRTLAFIKTEVENLGKADDVDEIKIVLEPLLKAIKTFDERRDNKQSSKLASYSKWLSKFSWLKDNMLEIPGQYNGLSEPKLHQHIRVAFFKPDVIVMKSLRQPIKMTIVGSNAKEYSFLVKFGEDIRQDERLQQLFGQMNNTLRCTKSTSHMQIDGYGVIPLTTSYGLIQWIDSVKSLKELMAIPHEDISKVYLKHINLLHRNPNNELQAYREAFLNKSNNYLITAFNSCVKQFNEDCLRNGLYKQSASSEKFYWLRTNFAISLGTMNIAHWVLGVGDRHLENILISSATGRVLGIDFGMAFGFATQFLPLPELIPFRLTPQIVNVFKPFNECGWLKQTMISCIRALKEDSYLLLAILEVFVLEPCLDWVQQAKRLAIEQGESSFHLEWYGQSKVGVVKEKLSGGNPMKLVENDLETGQIKGDGLLRLKTVVRGLKESVRFNQCDTGLTPEQQVEALLDLATDPLVLSLTYAGWSPWL